MLITALLTGLMLTPAQNKANLQLPDLLQRVNEYAQEKLPALQAPDLKQLFKGEVVRLFVAPTEVTPCKAVGLLLSSQPRERLWLAIRTMQVESSDDYFEQRLKSDVKEEEVWYGHLKLPLFFGRRHWVISASDNRVLATRTNNLGWERHWKLVKDGERKAKHVVQTGQIKRVQPQDIDDTIYTPTNEGSWLLIALPGGKTLVGYQAMVVIGGLIPDQLVAQYSLYRISDLLHDIEAQAVSIQARYTTQHAPVIGGDGIELPRFLTKK